MENVHKFPPLLVFLPTSYVRFVGENTNKGEKQEE
jgi:hypothetical protein